MYILSLFSGAGVFRVARTTMGLELVIYLMPETFTLAPSRGSEHVGCIRRGKTRENLDFKKAFDMKKVFVHSRYE